MGLQGTPGLVEEFDPFRSGAGADLIAYNLVDLGAFVPSLFVCIETGIIDEMLKVREFAESQLGLLGAGSDSKRAVRGIAQRVGRYNHLVIACPGRKFASGEISI